MFASSFDKNIETATSNLLLEPDWPTIIQICDAIRQNDINAKQALASIRKKMTSANPHTALYALIVLESVVKNCGTPVHEEIASKASCEMFTSLINTTPHENVRNKMLELIQCWAYAFRSSHKYRAIKDTMNILKTEGRTFPELKEADAMFTSDTAPDWADGEVCHRCRVAFSFSQRKHHCRNCGQVFCGQCSSKTSTLPRFGIEKEVRVCDGCFTELQKPSAGAKAASAASSGAGRSGAESSDLPPEYLSSTLAQQTQVPTRKSAEELKEEEELQLALALSQSEAELQQQKKHARPNTAAATATTTSSSSFYPKATSPPAASLSPVTATAATTVAEETDPELARYLNRNYWEEQRHLKLDSPVSPSAPSPMVSLAGSLASTKLSAEEAEIDDFSGMMRTQVEIFVNRMKSDSSRGRNISNDSSVQTLFLNLTSMHSKLLTHIKEMDDKRMWYEQLQDKLAQVKDSRAALDVLRQEHQEKLRRQAEEAEHLRQMQMAQKLEIMRKKKQEFLQYQRQLAVQRMQEQEREMQMRQEQQKSQYMMAASAFLGQMPYSPQQQQQPPPSSGPSMNYPGYGPPAAAPFNTGGQLPRFGAPNPTVYNNGAPLPAPQPQQPSMMTGAPAYMGPQQQFQQMPGQMGPPMGMGGGANGGNGVAPQMLGQPQPPPLGVMDQQQHRQQQQQMNQPQMLGGQPPQAQQPDVGQNIPSMPMQQQPQQQPQQQQQHQQQQHQPAVQQPPVTSAPTPQPPVEQQAPPQTAAVATAQPPQPKEPEVVTAELISFD